MSLHDDLLYQAEYLAEVDPTRPRQVNLRRAISAAYYSLFHLLVFEASSLFAKDYRIASSINRAYAHAEISEVSKSFSNGDWPKAFDHVKAVFIVPAELKNVAQSFVDLQQARHDADYNLAIEFNRGDTLGLVEMAKVAFRDWKTVRRHDLARVYLGCFLLWKQWDKKR